MFLFAVLAPTFEYYPMKKEVLAARGGQAIIECKPRAAPRPKLTWSKGAEILRNSTRSVLLACIASMGCELLFQQESASHFCPNLGAVISTSVGEIASYPGKIKEYDFHQTEISRIPK